MTRSSGGKLDDSNARMRGSRRSDYLAVGRGDRFIVPVLRKWIEDRLSEALPCDGQRRRVLDVGCGMQPFRQLIESLQGEYYSMDAIQNADGTVQHVAPIDGCLPDSLLGDEKFQVILCTEVLEHVAGWQKAWRNLAELVEPLGVVIVTCPFVFHLHEQPHDFWRPTIHTLREYAESNNFEVIEVTRGGDAFDVLGTVLDQLAMKPKQGNPISWLGRHAVSFLRHVVAWLLHRRILHTLVMPAGELYLSNLGVFRRRR